MNISYFADKVNQTDSGLITGFCYWNKDQVSWIVIIFIAIFLIIAGIIGLWIADRKGWVKFDFPYEMEDK